MKKWICSEKLKLPKLSCKDCHPEYFQVNLDSFFISNKDLVIKHILLEIAIYSEN